jgi:hypothetical protein
VCEKPLCFTAKELTGRSEIRRPELRSGLGSKASIEWWDERPNQLSYEIQGRPAQVLERGMGYLYPEALADDRIGGGRPEGLFEAWSNLYARFAVAMTATDRGDTALLETIRYPDIGCLNEITAGDQSITTGIRR